jgi:hypothetical protein
LESLRGLLLNGASIFTLFFAAGLRSGEKKVKSNPLQTALTTKPKTSSAILKIL